MPETTLPHARIRPATVLDAPALAEAHLQAWQETYGRLAPEAVRDRRAREGLRWWEQALADPEAPTTWLAQRDGAAVGLARAIAPGVGHVRPLELQVHCVLAAEQGRRTGTHLLQMAIGDAPCALWVAQGDEHAQGFYRHHGFGLDGAGREVPEWGGVVQLRMVR